MSLGSEIVRLRMEKGLRQKDLAAHLEVRQSNLARWENNMARPRAPMLQRIAQMLDVSVDALLAAERGEHADPDLQEIDPSLVALLRQVHKLDTRDREGLKIILESMLTKTQMHDVLRRASSPAAEAEASRPPGPPRHGLTRQARAS